MFVTPFNVIFLFTLLSSTVLSISSSTWLGAWVGLEINLMSFVPLAIVSSGPKSSEGVLKYFLVQALSSLLLMFAILMWMLNEVALTPLDVTFMYLSTPMVALFIKLGAAPFHFWFPSVAAVMSWRLNFVLMTWQKVAPLILVYYLMRVGLISLSVMIISSVVGAVGALNEVSIRKLMAYSSINHISWMLLASFKSAGLVMVYFWVYSLTALVLMLVLGSLNLFYLSQILYISGSTWLFMMFVNVFSFGGLPPFLGFLSKWLVLDFVIERGWYGLALVLVMFSLISLFYYLRMAYAIFSQATSWNPASRTEYGAPLPVLVCSVVSILGVLLLPVASFVA